MDVEAMSEHEHIAFFQVRLDIFAPVSKSGQLEIPEIDSGKKISTETTALDGFHEIAVRAADQLERT